MAAVSPKRYPTSPSAPSACDPADEISVSETGSVACVNARKECKTIPAAPNLHASSGTPGNMKYPRQRLLNHRQETDMVPLFHAKDMMTRMKYKRQMAAMPSHAPRAWSAGDSK